MNEPYPNGLTREEWYRYCKSRQSELFPHDGELLAYTEAVPTTATIGELLRAKGYKVA